MLSPDYNNPLVDFVLQMSPHPPIGRSTNQAKVEAAGLSLPFAQVPLRRSRGTFQPSCQPFLPGILLFRKPSKTQGKHPVFEKNDGRK